jgi:hypothetical protein
VEAVDEVVVGEIAVDEMATGRVAVDEMDVGEIAFDTIAAASAPTGDLPAPEPRPVPALRIPVDFRAPDSGIGELTRGQMEIWLGMTRQGWLHLVGTKPLPTGTTLPEIVDELRYLMTRYPSMRTRLRFDAQQRPTQRLFDSGEITLEVFDTDYTCPSEADKGEVGGVTTCLSEADKVGGGAVTTCPSEADTLAAVVLAHDDTTVRDFAREWPVRMAVVRHRGELTHMVVLMCRLVTDGAGAQVMLREVPVRERAPVTGPQQLDLARWQYSSAGQQHNAAALRHWEKTLRSLPHTPYPVSDDWREPRHWSGEYTSPALYLAVPEIAERTQTTTDVPRTAGRAPARRPLRQPPCRPSYPAQSRLVRRSPRDGCGRRSRTAPSAGSRRSGTRSSGCSCTSTTVRTARRTRRASC